VFSRHPPILFLINNNNNNPPMVVLAHPPSRAEVHLAESTNKMSISSSAMDIIFGRKRKLKP
jgi:hypothetical protein